MPKEKDPEKQKLIRVTARRLFSGREGKTASMRDLAEAVGMTVSNLYTYYGSRAEIIQDIIEEAWSWFQANCERDMAGEADPSKCMRIFTGLYLTELLADKDIISLLLDNPEAVKDIAAKLDFVSRMVGKCMDADARKPGREVVAIFFLGALSSTAFSGQTNLNINEKDILTAIREILRPGEYGLLGK